MQLSYVHKYRKSYSILFALSSRNNRCCCEGAKSQRQFLETIHCHWFELLNYAYGFTIFVPGVGKIVVPVRKAAAKRQQIGGTYQEEVASQYDGQNLWKFKRLEKN
jgi:hypothetical protein